MSAVTDLSSDHIPAHLQLGLQPSPHNYTHSLVNRHTDCDLYRDLLEAVSQHHLPIDTELELETVVAELTFALQEAASLSTPPSSLIIYSTASPAYSNLCHERRRSRKHWQTVRSESAKREYRRCNNEVRRELRDSQNDSFQAFMSTLLPYHDSEYTL